MLALLPFRLEHFVLDYRNAKSEVLTMVAVKVGVLWNVKPCILVKFYGRSGETICLSSYSRNFGHSVRAALIFTVFSNTLLCY